MQHAMESRPHSPDNLRLRHDGAIPEQHRCDPPAMQDVVESNHHCLGDSHLRRGQTIIGRYRSDPFAPQNAVEMTHHWPYGSHQHRDRVMTEQCHCEPPTVHDTAKSIHDGTDDSYLRGDSDINRLSCSCCGPCATQGAVEYNHHCSGAENASRTSRTMTNASSRARVPMRGEQRRGRERCEEEEGTRERTSRTQLDDIH